MHKPKLWLQTTFVACGLLASLGGHILYAQVNIYVDPENRGRDTLDFGYALAGDTVLRQLTIENNSTYDVVIIEGIRPYLWIEPTPPYNTNDPDEFPLEALFPFVIPAGQTRSYPLRYIATFFPQYPEGRHQVALNVSVRRSDDTASSAGERRFILRATKSFRYLWSDRPIVDFDSVYVKPLLLRSSSFHVGNVGRKRVTAQVILEGDALSHQGFEVDIEGTESFSSGLFKEYAVRFAPLRRGIHTLDVLFVQPSLMHSGQYDTTAIQLRGVGVEQNLKMAAAVGYMVQLNADTVLLRHRRLGRRDTVLLIITNTGNIPANIVATTIEGDGSDAISVLHLMRTDRSLHPGTADTLILAVHPRQAGIVFATITIHTDLRSRAIWGLPLEADFYRFTVAIEGVKQQLVPLQTSVDLGSVLALGHCVDSPVDTLRILNQSNSVLYITSLSVPAPFVTPVQVPIEVLPGAIGTIPISIGLPRDTGLVTATIRIESTDTAYSPIHVPLMVYIVAPVIPYLRIDTTSYTPGTDLTIPILIEKNHWFYSQVSFVLSIDPTMGELLGFRIAGTAAQNANVVDSILAPGTYRIQVDSPLGLLPRDSLVVLRIKTYLGQLPRGSIHLEKVFAGTTRCPNAIRGIGQGAIMEVAPFCGMDRTFPIDFPTIVLIDGYAEIHGILAIEVWSISRGYAQLEIFAPDGRQIHQYMIELQGGRQKFVISHHMSSGIYALRLRSTTTSSESNRVVLLH